MPWPQTGATHYHAQSGLSDKVCAIKGWVVCYVVWLGSMTYENGLWTSARCVVLSLVVVRMANEPKYRNTAQIHTKTKYIIIIRDISYLIVHCPIPVFRIELSNNKIVENNNLQGFSYCYCITTKRVFSLLRYCCYINLMLLVSSIKDLDS